jgi:predicted DNA-binding antitoxin AbrB/MazE fold protein
MLAYCRPQAPKNPWFGLRLPGVTFSATFNFVTTTVEAIYENGTLRLRNPLPLPESSLVLVTIQSDAISKDDSERAAWLKLSEQALAKSWGDPADDVFNELLEK